MHELLLAPYFHPTTICFLDDNESFLESLDLELPGNWACRTFTDPFEALEFLQTPQDLPPLMDRCFSLQQRPDAQATIHLDLQLVEQEINHVDRFKRNSVVLIDYAMPSMDGLQFCTALQEPYIRKAMLTGVADEKIAVQAFNAGLIHRFIPKHTNGAIEVIKKFVDDLQLEYFQQYSARLQSMLAINPPGFLIDREIARRVESLMSSEGLIEYYLTHDPAGLMLLKSNGQIWRLAVLSEQQMQAQHDYAAAHHAPASVLQAMAQGLLIGFFGGNAPEDYYGDEGFPWQEVVHPAEKIVGSEGIWHVAIWKNAPADIDFDPASASYDAYLGTL